MDFIDLRNKKILYISVKTFNYEVEIASKLVSLGAFVDYFDERPSNSIFVKGIIRFKKSLFQKKINSYYINILNEINIKEYDFLFVVKGEVIPSFFLNELRSRLPKCKFIYYTWDSFDNNPNALSILHYFDKKLSFDNQDAKKYNLEFRPLFYIDKYRKLNNLASKNIKYSLLFIGTAHSDRYIISNIIINWCSQNNFSSFAYYFMASRLVFLDRKSVV